MWTVLYKSELVVSADGNAVGTEKGALDLLSVVGVSVVGKIVETRDGISEGASEGHKDGDSDGSTVGYREGISEGSWVGGSVGLSEGD